MEYSFTFINGVALGVEYVPSSLEEDIEFPCLVIDLLFVRIVLEFTGE